VTPLRVPVIFLPDWTFSLEDKELRWIRVADAGAHDGEKVEIRGWLYNRRSSGKIQFLLLRDGSGVIQCVAGKSDIGEEAFEQLEGLPQESALVVVGALRADKRAPGGYELGVESVRIVHTSEPYPITPKEHGVEFLMDHRHLWLRSRRQHAILRIRAALIAALRDFFDGRGFVLIDAPIFTPAACEGTSTLFETDYFDEKAYLTQSGQLYMEAAAMAFGQVYCFGPTFRAEKSKTRRHLTEFWMLEPEVAYATLDDVMQLQEEMIVGVVGRLLEQCAEEFKHLERDTGPLEAIQSPFPRLPYDEAVKLLAEEGHEFEWGGDFGSPDETAISNRFDRPVFVHRFPGEIKAFYMEPDPDRSELSLSVDCLAPEGYGEITGGGQRTASLELLDRRIAEHGLPCEAFEWYRDLRRFGSVPHSGFGIGVERTLAWLCKLDHVRETIPFPRMMHRLTP
jgi:asparaginyl-tRNA synthetase